MFTPTNYNPYFFPSSSSNPFFLTNPDPNAAPSSANTSFHLHDPLALPFLNAPITPDVTLSNLGTVSDFAPVCAKQDIIPPHYAGYHHSNSLAAGNFLKKPPSSAAKKDRHSKIHTSQGLRDRRVRLSIEIARKFFDLQDMLGFDKASNTLDWLFSKSKKAIRELELAAQCKNNSSSTNTNTRASSSDDEDNGRKRKEKEKKESREKARARARERTSHKGKSLVENANSISNEKDMNNDYNNYEGGREEFKVIEESIVIKRKLKQQQQSNLVASHPQNQLVDVIPNKELPTFTNTNTTLTVATTNNAATNHRDDDDDDHYSIFPNLSPNWDSNARSNFCAIASMNLSTGTDY